INTYVRLTAVFSAAAMVIAGLQAPAFPGGWGIGALAGLVFVLEVSSTTLRGGDAKGSLAFFAELSTGILFGGFWGGVLTGVSAFAAHKYSKRPTIRAAFNAFQKAFSVILAVAVYQFLGGTIPPSFLQSGHAVVADQLARGLVAFFIGSFTYI